MLCLIAGNVILNFGKMGLIRLKRDQNFGQNLVFGLREAVKNILMGGSLKFAAKGRETLTPPKNPLYDMYPP